MVLDSFKEKSMQGEKRKLTMFFLLLCWETTLAGIFEIWPFNQFLNTSIDMSPIETKRSKGLDFAHLVERHGYPSEEYMIQTSDGYQLLIHRIPGSPTSPKFAGKPVVYMQHGMVATSDFFVVAGPKKDLAYILADAGYDVWIGNTRGNSYCRAHVTLNPDKDSEFWDFSVHEIALYDLSATIDYVLNSTGQLNVIYVGHSMATTMSIILLSTITEFNNKIRLVINMGTVCNYNNQRNFIKFVYSYGPYFWPVLNAIGFTELVPRTLIVGEIMNNTCLNGGFMQMVCITVIEFIAGYDLELLDMKLVSEGGIYYPGGGSWRTLDHYYQILRKSQLLMYDYGVIENFLRYGNSTPPGYNLENIVAPMFMLYSKNDAVTPYEDSLELASILRHGRAESVPHDKFNHLDYVWAKNVENLLHARVLDIITKFTRQGKSLEEL